MTLTRKKMVREIGRRIRLKNRNVQLMLVALIEVWTEELVAGGRIEIENLFVLEVKEIDRGESAGTLNTARVPRIIRRVSLRMSKKLRKKLQD